MSTPSLEFPVVVTKRLVDPKVSVEVCPVTGRVEVRVDHLVCPMGGARETINFAPRELHEVVGQAGARKALSALKEFVREAERALGESAIVSTPLRGSVL